MLDDRFLHQVGLPLPREIRAGVEEGGGRAVYTNENVWSARLQPSGERT